MRDGDRAFDDAVCLLERPDDVDAGLAGASPDALRSLRSVAAFPFATGRIRKITDVTRPILPGASRWPELDAFTRFWRAKAPPGGLPPKSAMDPIEMWRWLGYLSIVEVVDGGADYRVRLHGPQVAAAAGIDLTGRNVSHYPGERRVAMRESYQLAVESRAPCYSSIILRPSDRPRLVIWERLFGECRAEAEGHGMLVRVIDDPKIDWW